VSRDFYRLKILQYDNAGSPSQAVANVRRAIAAGAVAIVSDGTGVDASWRIANKAHVPIAIVYDGGTGLVDPRTRPNVFRIAPTNHGISFRLAEYLVPKKLKVAFLTDDTGYGREGRASLDRAFAENGSSVVARIQIPSTSTDLAPQILQARRAGATALLVWAEPAGVAEAVIAARTSGWKVPVYTPPSGEDPLVRQELAAHPDWLDGLTFAAGRMTAEQGPIPFLRFQRAYENAFGAQDVGVKAADGRPVGQPPDYASTRTTSYGYSRRRSGLPSRSTARRYSTRSTRFRSRAPTATSAASTRRTTRAWSTTTSTSRASPAWSFAP